MKLKELLVDLILVVICGEDPMTLIKKAREYKATHENAPDWVNCLCNDLGLNSMATAGEAFEDWQVSDD